MIDVSQAFCCQAQCFVTLGKAKAQQMLLGRLLVKYGYWNSCDSIIHGEPLGKICMRCK